MPVVRKFLFEHSFDPPPEIEVVQEAAPPVPEPPPEPTFSREELDAAIVKARQDGFAAGTAAGRKAEQDTTERLLALALNQISSDLAALMAGLETMRTQRDVIAAEVGTVLTRRFLPHVSRETVVEEITGMVGACLADLHDQPRVVVRVAPALADAVTGPLEQIVHARGLHNAFTISSDPALGASDVRVEWADGAAERSETRFWAEVDAVARKILAKPSDTVPA